ALQRVQADVPENARFTACAVEFSVETTLRLRPDVFAKGTDWTDAEHTQYENLMSTQRGIQNRLLGHADAIQDDMHIQAHLLANRQPLTAQPSAQAQAASRDWLLLFQMDSDPNAGMQWGNSGRLYYWIHRGDLQSRQFDHTWLILQSE